MSKSHEQTVPGQIDLSQYVRQDGFMCAASHEVVTKVLRRAQMSGFPIDKLPGTLEERQAALVKAVEERCGEGASGYLGPSDRIYLAHRFGADAVDQLYQSGRFVM